MQMRWTLSAVMVFAMHGACGASVGSSADGAAADAADARATRDVATPEDAALSDSAQADATPMGSGTRSIQVASAAALHTTAMLRTATQLLSATIWTGRGSHETLSLHAFSPDGTSPRALGSMFFRAGEAVPSLARSSIASSGPAVLVAHARNARHEALGRWASATGVAIFAADGSGAGPTADYDAGTRTVLAGETSPALAPSVTAGRDGFFVLDLSVDQRLRLTALDRAGAVVGQQQFALPFALAQVEDVRAWAVQARGETFVVATNDESWRLLEVSERGVVNLTDAIRPISRVQSRPWLCAGEGEAFEFAQSAENSATLWALDRSPSSALSSAPLEETRPLRACAEPRLWLRSLDVVRSTEGADLWDADAGCARCQPELTPSVEGVARTIDVSGRVAIAADVEGDASNLAATIVLRAIPLQSCITTR